MIAGRLMTELSAEPATATCAWCGEARAPSDVASLMCHPEIAVCAGCVHYLAGNVTARPWLTPIFPVHGMAAAHDFWTRARALGDRRRRAALGG